MKMPLVFEKLINQSKVPISVCIRLKSSMDVRHVGTNTDTLLFDEIVCGVHRRAQPFKFLCRVGLAGSAHD